MFMSPCFLPASGKSSSLYIWQVLKFNWHLLAYVVIVLENSFTTGVVHLTLSNKAPLVLIACPVFVCLALNHVSFTSFWFQRLLMSYQCLKSDIYQDLVTCSVVYGMQHPPNYIFSGGLGRIAWDASGWTSGDRSGWTSGDTSGWTSVDTSGWISGDTSKRTLALDRLLQEKAKLLIFNSQRQLTFEMSPLLQIKLNDCR